MPDFSALGKMLVILGILIIVIGGTLVLTGRISGIGRLPGDVYFQKGNFTFYFPIATSIIISIILTIILNLVFRR